MHNSSVNKTTGVKTFTLRVIIFSFEIISVKFPQNLIKSNKQRNINYKTKTKGKMLCIIKSAVAVLVVGSLMLVDRVDCGSCRESTLCCNGRDSSCVVQKAPINSIIEDLNDKPCYCDHACLKLGDCCSDFKQYCGGK